MNWLTLAIATLISIKICLLIQTCQECLIYIYIDEWKSTVNSSSSRRGNLRIKLRTYTIFKQDCLIGNYCKLLIPFSERCAFAKIRCGGLLSVLKLEGMKICQLEDVVLIVLIWLKMNIMLFYVVLFINILGKFFLLNLLILD